MSEREPVPNKAELVYKWREKIRGNPTLEISSGDLLTLAQDVLFLETGIDPTSQPGESVQIQYEVSSLGLFYTVGFLAGATERPLIGSQTGTQATFTDPTGKSLGVTEILHPTITIYQTLAEGIPVNISDKERRKWAENIWRMYEAKHGQETP